MSWSELNNMGFRLRESTDKSRHVDVGVSVGAVTPTSIGLIQETLTRVDDILKARLHSMPARGRFI